MSLVHVMARQRRRCAGAIHSNSTCIQMANILCEIFFSRLHLTIKHIGSKRFHIVQACVCVACDGWLVAQTHIHLLGTRYVRFLM